MSATVRVFAPASMGNVAAGFDVLGAALQPLDGTLWGDVVAVTPADRASFHCTGPYADRLPANPADNLVARTWALFAAALSTKEHGFQVMPPMAVTLEKGLPIASGVGSSSASVVAAAVALNAACGYPLDIDAVLSIAVQAEGAVAGAMHLDNVAPCLLGGLRLVTPQGGALALPWPDDLLFVIASPELELPTSRARAALPRDVPLALAVAHAQNLACLIHALHTNDRALTTASLRDLLAEPHRAELVRGFRTVQAAARAAGALACSLAGAGPAVFAVATPDRAQAVAEAMRLGFGQSDIVAHTRACRLDVLGARLLE